MAIVIESSTEYSAQDIGTVSDPITLTAPSGIQSDDLLYIITMRDNSFITNDEYRLLIPDGWTEHLYEFSEDQLVQIQTMYKVSDGTEGNITTYSSFDRDTVAWYIRISGVSTTSPINTTGSFVDDRGSLTVPGVTTSTTGCTAILMFGYDGGDGNPFSISGSGWPSSVPNNQYEEAQFNGVGTISGGWITKSIGNSTSSGDAIITDNGENDGIAGIQIALTPSDTSGYSNSVSGVSVQSFSGISTSDIGFISGV